MISQNVSGMFNCRALYASLLVSGITILFYLHFTGSDRAIKHRAWQVVEEASRTIAPHVAPEQFNGTWEFNRDSRHLSFDKQQCDAFFPNLYFDIDRAVQARNGRHITFEEIDSIKPLNGYVRAMIFDQQLYIIDIEGGSYTRGLATLLAIHRAILTSPDPVPNIEFTFSVADHAPSSTHWGLTRKKLDTTTWLMPDFAYWSWPETKIGSYHEVQDKALLMENEDNNPSGKAWGWAYKIPKLFWRGAIQGLSLRKKLIKATEGKVWADVKAMDWSSKSSTQNDIRTMDEHCQYKYLVNTAGQSYSGRLKFIQNCRSVIFMHEMEWLTHHTHLMVDSGPEQNYVLVRRDFSDLEEKILALQDDDTQARRIADNSVRVFRERYLTPAAETCYWRQLFRSWADISFEPFLWEDYKGTPKSRGVAFESYALMQKLDWDAY